MSLPPPPPGGPPQFQPQPGPVQQPGPYGQPGPFQQPGPYGQPGPFQQPGPYGQPYQQFPVAGGGQQGPQPSGPSRPVSSALAIAGLVCAAVAAIGSVLPWATVDTSGFGDDYGLGDISQDGLDADGKITIVLALIAAGFLVAAIVTKRLWTVITTTSIFAITALIAVADIADVKTRFDELDGLGFGFEVSVGIGLWVLLLASIAGAIVSFIAIFARPQRIS